jgi:hypothetical protein
VHEKSTCMWFESYVPKINLSLRIRVVRYVKTMVESYETACEPQREGMLKCIAHHFSNI